MNNGIICASGYLFLDDFLFVDKCDTHGTEKTWQQKNPISDLVNLF